MASWQQDYLLALEARDRSEQSHKDFYDAYSKLADRTARIETHKNSDNRNVVEAADPVSTKPHAHAATQAPTRASSETEALARTRTDLSEAQRSRGILQSKLQEATNDLQQLRLQSAVDRRRLDELTSGRANLAIRLKDRDEELKGKAKLLEDIHDETVSLTLQLNMAEEQAQKLRKENEDLIARWMSKMGKEAEAMNEASKFH
ncbi:MAG: hypothetical protein Q9219_003633 [cf. Caloplaca sp. 3 TL-2023]